MDNFSNRLSRKQKRNNGDMNSNGSRKMKRRKNKFMLTKKGKYVGVFTLAMLGIIIMGYAVVHQLNRHSGITASYANVTGDIITISPKLAGKISTINVNNGDTVSENEVLFTLDTEVLKNQVDEAYANMQLTFEQLEKAGGGLKATGAKRSQKTAKNKKNGKQSNKSGKASSSSGGTITMLQNAVKAAQSRYNMARLALNNSSILSPAAGTIIESTAHVGDYVSPAHGVMTIVNFKDLKITAYVKPSVVDEVSVGLPARIKLATIPGKVFIGTVMGIGKTAAGLTDLVIAQSMTDQKKLRQLIPVTIAFDYGSEGLIPGIDASVTIERSK